MKREKQLSFEKIPENKGRYEFLKSKSRQEIVDVGGRIFQLLGLPRSTGQILGLLFFSTEPLSLEIMSSTLGISKGSASSGTRKLASWGAIRRIWIPGDRRDYYEVIEDLGRVIRSFYDTLINQRIRSSKSRLTSIENKFKEDIMTGVIHGDTIEILEVRINFLKKYQGKINKLMPLIDKFLK